VPPTKQQVAVGTGLVARLLEGKGAGSSGIWQIDDAHAAVRMVRTLRAELGTEHGTVQSVAAQFGYGTESVRSWVRQADIDASGGQRWVGYDEAWRLDAGPT